MNTDAPTVSPSSLYADTHEVTNQSNELAPYNLYGTDRALQEAVDREGAAWARDAIAAFGRIAGHELMPLGFLANDNKPVFYSHDRFGHRIDRVEFHPAYHELMRTALQQGLHAAPWREPKPGAQVARSAKYYMYYQAEAGSGCPVTMTHAAIPAIRFQPDVAREWEPRIVSLDYDASDRPVTEKTGATIGMAMTEKQGGSDVRANTTKAVALGQGGPGQAYELVGHKWFCSAPMCDAFLVLAQTDKGLSCFLMPRWRPDGSKNAFYIQRLKNKLGNWSNASSEMEFRGAFAWMLGEEGRGVNTIIEMVSCTRYDCMLGSSALMRQASAQALHHCAHRAAFGKTLIDQPLMQNVLADLALESEASLAFSLRIGRALDNSAQHEQERLLARIATAIGKYWICKRTPGHVNEAQECLGGAGYVEESILPRLYREAPLNSIWEGCANVQCLDVLRAMSKEPRTVDALMAELQGAAGVQHDYDRTLAALGKALTQTDNLEYHARHVVERMALLLEASVLIKAGNGYVSDAFCRSRLTEQVSLVYGSLPSGVHCDALIQRAMPQQA